MIRALVQSLAPQVSLTTKPKWQSLRTSRCGPQTHPTLQDKIAAMKKPEKESPRRERA